MRDNGKGNFLIEENYKRDGGLPYLYIGVYCLVGRLLRYEEFKPLVFKFSSSRSDVLLTHVGGHSNNFDAEEF